MVRCSLLERHPRLGEYRSLNRAGATQNAYGKVKKCREQRENTMHRDTNDSKRQRDEPHNGEQHYSQQGQRPAEDKHDAPE